MKNKIRIGIADGCEQNRLHFKNALEDVINYNVVFEANNDSELYRKLNLEEVDVLLINYQMPLLSYAHAIQNLKTDYPYLKIILTALYKNPLLLWNYMNMGVNGLLLNKAKITQIYRSIEEVIKIGYYCPAAILKSIASLHKKSQSKSLKFNQRELDVIGLICKEKSSAEIAEILFVSKRTVDWYRKNIMKQIGVKTAIGVVKYALFHNLVSFDELE